MKVVLASLFLAFAPLVGVHAHDSAASQAPSATPLAEAEDAAGAHVSSPSPSSSSPSQSSQSSASPASPASPSSASSASSSVPVSSTTEPPDRASTVDASLPARVQPWTDRAVEMFGELPVQDGGRIKPISTYASFTLLRLAAHRSARDVSGASIDPVDWMLDVLFFPEDAVRCDVFLVTDSDALVAAGLTVGDKRKRDRWSYAELQPCLPKLFSLAHDYDAIDPKARTTVQQQVVDLASNVMSFLRLARFLDFARDGNPTYSNGLAILPPPSGSKAGADWRTPADLLGDVGPDRALAPQDSAALSGLRTMLAQRDRPAAFEAALASLREHVVSAATARGEYEHVRLERDYYAANPLGWSLGAFLAGFLACALTWLRPRNASLRRIAIAIVSSGTALLIAAIVVRCIIRGRPPVSTLYETVLFTTACATLVALFLEFVHRSRVAVGAAAILGTIGLFVATGYETLDKQDTMPSLVAVLDTNFWLATHVTAITIGYSAGMLAAFLGSAYLVLTLFGWKRADPAARRELARMTYGVLCFALIFSTVGTILGGVWANESWGRFWGWDPKENGALLIVISQIVMLHARRGGYLRDHGTCMAAAFGGTIIAFSWWGVNLLGVGLHSYGFTSGIHRALWTYYAIQWSVVGLGGVAWLTERRAASIGSSRGAASSSTEPAVIRSTPRNRVAA